MVPIVDRLIHLLLSLLGTESSWIGQCKCFIYIILLDTSIGKTSLKPKHWGGWGGEQKELGLGRQHPLSAANQCYGLTGGPIFFNVLGIVMAEDLHGTASPKVLSP